MFVETAPGLMTSFGSLIATIIFGILAVVNDNQKEQPSALVGRRLFFKNNIKLVTVLNGAVRRIVSATPLFVSIITALLIFYN